jgi:hypothetical protein
MSNDFETMPVGTAALLRDVANWLRGEHTGMVEQYRRTEEKAEQATGWRRDAELELMGKIMATSHKVEQQIGSIEALLDRCPHAPPVPE